ncbi:MAG: hypothetical protein RL758_264 [Pseudomonadota bacterium]|jgi:hypothetical protein
MDITIVTPGTRVASGAASAGAALPNDASGTLPLRIRVATTAAAHFRMGAGAQTATTNDMLISPGEALTLSVPRGINQFACIQASTGGFVQVSPVE